MNPILAHFGKAAKAYIASLLVAVYGAVEPSFHPGAVYTWSALWSTVVATVLTWVTVYGIPNAVREIVAALGTPANPMVVVMHSLPAVLAPVVVPAVEQLVHVAYPAPAGEPTPAVPAT